jgi:biopolymer transport protein ExbD
MRIPLSYSHASERAEVAMTPMIDVVFLLLIFFLWTSSFQAIETLLPSHLTTAGGGAGSADLAVEDFEHIVIRLAGDRASDVAWQINGQPVPSLDDLHARLRTLAGIRPDLPVIIDPDDGVPFGPIIDVYDTALSVGFSNLQFATKAELLAAPLTLD